jgi:uncharacterized protein YggE
VRLAPPKIAAILICGCLNWAHAAEPARPDRRVTVQGHGKLKAVPDLARLQIAVTEEGRQVETVTQMVRNKMDAVMKALRSQGIADKDIQTQSYRITPKTAWNGGKTQRDGFSVANQVDVTVRDLKKTGAVLAAVQNAGANEINGPQFEVAAPQELERRALGIALEDARAKAKVLADAAGAGLGEALSIEESAGYRPGPHPVMMRAMASAAPATEEPISAGEETVEATVTASFRLK